MYVVAEEPLITSSYEFCEPYVFSSSGAMSAGPVQGPARDVDQKSLFGFGTYAVFADNMR
jgi:hypothetical protein